MNFNPAQRKPLPDTSFWVKVGFGLFVVGAIVQQHTRVGLFVNLVIFQI